MIYIAHRGNTQGPKPELENQPDYILAAVKEGFDVEVDVWCFDQSEKCWLGHDEPQYQVTTEWLANSAFWCHAKNLLALNVLLDKGIHCFWHQGDDFTLTNKGYIWTYPGKPASRSRSVVVTFDDQPVSDKFEGVCSDYVEKIRQ